MEDDKYHALLFAIVIVITNQDSTSSIVQIAHDRVVPKALAPSAQSAPSKKMIPLSMHCLSGKGSILLGLGAL
jgi:hypothetical protein